MKKPVNLNDQKLYDQTNAIRGIQLTLMPSDLRRAQIEKERNGHLIGRITSSKTLNYKSLKPEPNGLFCERIFGPVQDFVCSCGKKRKGGSLYCPDCDVEYISSRARRYRLGYIMLGAPVIHTWYLRGRPSYVSLLLDMRKKNAEAIAYSSRSIFYGFNQDFGDRIHVLRQNFHENYTRWKEYQYHNSVSKWRWSALILDKSITNKEFASITSGVYKGDDFWVPASHRFGFPWSPRDFHKTKPFYIFPMFRDHVGIPTIITRVIPIEYGLFPESYSFIDALRPLPKYKKGIANSMIWQYRPPVTYDPNPNAPIPMVPRGNYLLTGATAFSHLFAKIDAKRAEMSIYAYLKRVRKRLIHAQHWLNNADKYHLDKKQKRWYKRLIRNLSLVIPKQARRAKLFHSFWTTYSRPEWMFISVLPVLPPDLRPIIKMDGNQLAISDLNKLYQLVFYRNTGLKRAMMNLYVARANPYKFEQFKSGTTNVPVPATKMPETFTEFLHNFKNLPYAVRVLSFHHRLLQEAVDALLDNGKGGSKPIRGTNDRPLKSLSDILKGKKGRFRQNLLGKRVDYSGRSVIVVGPTLKLYECGLPKEIATELFQALLIRKLLERSHADTIIGAKKIIAQDHPIIWPILNEVIETYPILLNRAPTLHRLGVQAFLPKLVRGKAILLHPLVCPAFNADFDGDQMGVHLPLSMEARSEAWSLMLSTQNLLSPATGDPIVLPSQDMVLGCYYLTTANPAMKKTQYRYFSNCEDVIQAHLNQQLHPHTFIWVKWNQSIYSDQKHSRLLEMRITPFGTQTLLTPTLQRTKSFDGGVKSQFLKTTIGRVLLNTHLNTQINESQLTYCHKN